MSKTHVNEWTHNILSRGDLQVASAGTSKYLGKDRLFVVSPRGHMRKGASFSVTAQAFLQQPWNASSERQPSLMLRSLNIASAVASRSKNKAGISFQS